MATALLLAVAGLLTLQSLDVWDTRAPVPFPARRGPAPRVTLGVTTVSLARNSYRPWGAADLAEVNNFEQRARQHAGIVMWFVDWQHGRFNPRQAAAVERRGSVPEISWEPWDASIGPGHPQARYTLASIIDGRHDAYIRRFASAVKRYGHPLRIRFSQEMNGRWYPWAEAFNGNRPGEFARAWRHVHGIFTALGANNVTWIWAPVAGHIPRNEYPGDAVVDVVGISGFNGGTILFARRWRPFSTSFSRALDAVSTIAPNKPIEISEVASTELGGDKAKWISDMFAELRRRPAVRSLVWFNLRKESDWRISSSPRAQTAFATGLQRLNSGSSSAG